MPTFAAIIVDVFLHLSDEFIIHLIIIKIIIRCFKAASDCEAFQQICLIPLYGRCIPLPLFAAVFEGFIRGFHELVSMDCEFSPYYDVTLGQHS